ncbi:hypothetical protein SerAS12_2575 [Serratia sp. AS12]|uniref:hypothetical protein n=1 Tax=Serratia TaxID=613 RepID=UPI00020E9EEB|nr:MULTISPECIES: hypothetical protein [Serratia]AEF45697.1 hypothetical protein SerAS9_2574 [Serratia plymuthica AS9]AEF50648.1 hypothetical protein SerAS12_2575 [Serratia sp. AS12]AEG28355.1 hypothetical protein SerAS13_2576 [Serratia sp. AS13]MBJ7890914.1 hypothetical protein [Serratia sp. PAMC26656]UTN94460.1 hypothetical protein NLX81_13140 [Serratia plymuthica]
MSHLLIALALLALLPATLHAAQKASGISISGTLSFAGKIATPTCEIRRDNGQFISSCYRETAGSGFGYIAMPLSAMSSELISDATIEKVNNNPVMQRVTLSYN